MGLLVCSSVGEAQLRAPCAHPTHACVSGGPTNDLVSIGGTILNQSGQALEVVGIWMAVYLSLSLLTSGYMNWYNKRIALVER